MSRTEQVKLGDVFCQVGVYMLTAMAASQIFTDKMKWWMSVGFVVVGMVSILIGLRILHYVDD